MQTGMTSEEFFGNLEELGRRYKSSGTCVLKSLIGKHAIECGFDIDDNGPYEERDIIIEPLRNYLKAVNANADWKHQVALSHRAWQAYYHHYQVQKAKRLGLIAV